MADIEARIAQAWQDMKTRIEGGLASSTAGAAIPDFGNAADLNVCYTLNPRGILSQFFWGNGARAPSRWARSRFPHSAGQRGNLPPSLPPRKSFYPSDCPRWW